MSKNSCFARWTSKPGSWYFSATPPRNRSSPWPPNGMNSSGATSRPCSCFITAAADLWECAVGGVGRGAGWVVGLGWGVRRGFMFGWMPQPRAGTSSPTAQNQRSLLTLATSARCCKARRQRRKQRRVQGGRCCCCCCCCCWRCSARHAAASAAVSHCSCSQQDCSYAAYVLLWSCSGSLWRAFHCKLRLSEETAASIVTMASSG